jgi:hypothetical protein
MKKFNSLNITKNTLNYFLKIFKSKYIFTITSKEKKIPYDIENEFIEIFKKCRGFTMTSIERMYALYLSTKYVVNHNISGDIVECGVWRGGSMMLCALTLLNMDNREKKIFLYDTFEGMPKPTDKDIRAKDKKKAYELLTHTDIEIRKSFACISSEDEVKKNLYSIKYPKENLEFIKGKVEDTIPRVIPEKISILRLDTDWFSSTYHELCYLFPKLSTDGVIIIDDYGYWKGARDATDKYFKENNIKILLNRIDQTGRIGIKTN